MLKTCMICKVGLYLIVTFPLKLQINSINEVLCQGLEDDGDEGVKVVSLSHNYLDDKR